MATETEYQGWKNRATWNVALYLNNEYSIYKAACEFMRGYKGKCPYVAFCNSYGLTGEKTPDGFKWRSQKLDYKSLNEMMRELVA